MAVHCPICGITDKSHYQSYNKQAQWELLKTTLKYIIVQETLAASFAEMMFDRSVRRNKGRALLKRTPDNLMQIKMPKDQRPRAISIAQVSGVYVLFAELKHVWKRVWLELLRKTEDFFPNSPPATEDNCMKSVVKKPRPLRVKLCMTRLYVTHHSPNERFIFLYKRHLQGQQTGKGS